MKGKMVFYIAKEPLLQDKDDTGVLEPIQYIITITLSTAWKRACKAILSSNIFYDIDTMKLLTGLFREIEGFEREKSIAIIYI